MNRTAAGWKITQGPRVNARIAGHLVISERTVKSHVNNILGKLHLVDRTQAAIFAWRQGIMEQ